MTLATIAVIGVAGLVLFFRDARPPAGYASIQKWIEKKAVLRGEKEAQEEERTRKWIEAQRASK